MLMKTPKALTTSADAPVKLPVVYSSFDHEPDLSQKPPIESQAGQIHTGHLNAELQFIKAGRNEDRNKGVSYKRGGVFVFHSKGRSLADHFSGQWSAPSSVVGSVTSIKLKRKAIRTLPRAQPRVRCLKEGRHKMLRAGCARFQFLAKGIVRLKAGSKAASPLVKAVDYRNRLSRLLLRRRPRRFRRSGSRGRTLWRRSSGRDRMGRCWFRNDRFGGSYSGEWLCLIGHWLGR
jgi:hypothetical protein